MITEYEKMQQAVETVKARVAAAAATPGTLRAPAIRQVAADLGLPPVRVWRVVAADSKGRAA